MKHSESIKAIAAALAKAQGQMEGASKDSANPHFKSRYASLSAVVDAIKGPLAENGIAYFQTPCTNERNECGVDTLLMHSSGEWIHAEPYFVPVSKADAQGFGSALTYCRRYSLLAAAGIAPEDDDGNAAASSKPTMMGVGDFGKHKVAIGTAQTANDLRAAFTAAYSAAQALGDKDAATRLTDLKDLRKQELLDLAAMTKEHA